MNALIEAGADTELKDKDGDTAAIYATKIEQSLREAGAAQ